MGSRVNSHEPLKIIHVFMVSFPGQGHVNPLLRLAKRLADFGMFITLATPELIGVSIRKANNLAGNDRFMAGTIRFEFFDDGWEVNDPKRSDLESYMAQLELVGRQKLPNMIRKHEEMGLPVSCIINNPFIPWVFDIAESLGIPSALFWVQSCACFSAYYHYGNNLVPFPSEEEPKIDVQLPHMPLLKYDEVPSFLHPSTPYLFLGKIILGQCKKVTKGFCILMDTFQELEHDIIEHMSKISCPIKTIGPLFKGSNGSTSSESNSNIRADFFTVENNCIKWLDAKPPRTVVYISFGSVVSLKQEQIDEIAHGLMGSEISFLWVLRPPLTESDGQAHVLPEGFLEKVGERGKIVKWSPQEKVLAHPSTACFLTHCGWNSTMEALASGVSVVAFPQWGDQVTNAKFLVDVFKVGVRLCRGDVEGRVVTRDEVKRCLKAAIDSVEAVEMKENALKWKKAAEEAVAEDGSSFKNIQDFVDEVVRVGCNTGSGKKENSLEIPYTSCS